MFFHRFPLIDLGAIKIAIIMLFLKDLKLLCLMFGILLHLCSPDTNK